MKRLGWVLVPVVLLVIVVFAARYLIEHTDGPQHERLGRPPERVSYVRPCSREQPILPFPL